VCPARTASCGRSKETPQSDVTCVEKLRRASQRPSQRPLIAVGFPRKCTLMFVGVMVMLRRLRSLTRPESLTEVNE
jgi:hypothetical protein